jgi:hypothetical protein
MLTTRDLYREVILVSRVIADKVGARDSYVLLKAKYGHATKGDRLRPATDRGERIR